MMDKKLFGAVILAGTASIFLMQFMPGDYGQQKAWFLFFSFWNIFLLTSGYLIGKRK